MATAERFVDGTETDPFAGGSRSPQSITANIKITSPPLILKCKHCHNYNRHNICACTPAYTSAKIILLNEWGCRDEMHHVKNRGNKVIPLAILSRILAQSCVTPLPYVGRGYT